jgi:ATP-dependent Lon protease
MNPIIFFDEVDKISKTEKGLELENLLINIIDVTQNYNYTDKYFQEITIDLSKILFIFSYNDSNNINHILKDRIYEIKISGYTYTEKLKLIKSYLIPNILQSFSFKNNDIIILDSSIKYIINTYSQNNSGVREIIKIFKNILAKIHIIYITNNSSLVNINNNIIFPLKLNKTNIKQFL